MKYGLLVIPLIALVGYFLFSAPAPTTGQFVNQASFVGEPFKGAADAPVVIEAWEDPQCPFCQRFTTNTLPEIERVYINTGQVKFVFRQFPIPNAHPWAIPASVALECAFSQDDEAFWALHDVYFQQQFAINTRNLRQLSIDTVTDYDVDLDSFATCIDNQESLGEVNQDIAEGISKGVSGTPTFFVNGQKVVGAQPFSVFASMIEAALRA